MNPKKVNLILGLLLLAAILQTVLAIRIAGNGGRAHPDIFLALPKDIDSSNLSADAKQEIIDLGRSNHLNSQAVSSLTRLDLSFAVLVTVLAGWGMYQMRKVEKVDGPQSLAL